jgi:colicin import membrane protein
LDEYHKSLFRKQKEEKSKSAAPSKSEHVGKTDKKRQEQEGKAAALKLKHHQDESPQDAPATVITQRPKSAARAGVRPSTRCAVFTGGDFDVSPYADVRGGPAERAAAEEKERQQQQADHEAELERQKRQEEAEQKRQEEAERRRQEALAAAEELKKKVWNMSPAKIQSRFNKF